jgi:CheY-like chemotaxis protein
MTPNDPHLYSVRLHECRLLLATTTDPIERAAYAAMAREFEAKLAKGPAASPEPASGTDRRRLLVIDDQPDVAQTLRLIGEAQGFEVEGVSDPTQAFGRFLAFEPDTIILDLVMPHVDGFEILQMIRASGRTPRILVMSGYGDFYLRMVDTLATGSGMVNVTTIGKPVSCESLERFLNHSASA